MSDEWTLAVDFGTTSTVTAIGVPDGPPEILEVDGDRKMPSMVVVDTDHAVVVGKAAAGLARSMPHRTIRTPKNRLGDAVPIVVAGTPFQAVTFVAAVLKHVLLDATRFQGSPPSNCRLTYPATWNRAKRDRLLEAAKAAGYPRAELVVEPIAAALTYADLTTLGVGDHVAVYDLGGGTFDTVVLQRTENGFSVVGRPLGDPQLGGELFDEILMNYVGEQIDQADWDQLLVSEETEWMRAAARLRAECRRAKEALSTHPIAEVSVGLPGGAIDVSITRDELDELIMPYVDESIALLGTCMTDAGQTGESVAAIYVIGGASRMPVVEKRVQEAYPNTLVSRRGDPKVAVALGALLAVPGSLAGSDRTTVEDDESSVPTPPSPPTIDVPDGAPTRIEGAHSVPETPEVTGATSSATVIGKPYSATSDSLAPGRPATFDEGIMTPQDAGFSPKIVIASLLAVLVLFGGIGALVLNGDDGAEVEATDTDTVQDEPDTTEPESTSSSETVAVSVPDEPEEDVADTAVDDSPTSITKESFEEAALTLEDLGFGWELHPAGPDLINRNLCGVGLPEGLLADLQTYRTIGQPEQLTTHVQLFVDGEQAGGLIEAADRLTTDCPMPEVPFSDDDPSDVLIGAPKATSADLSDLVIPDGVTSSSTFVYQFSNVARPKVNSHLISVDVQVGRSVETLVLFTPAEPDRSHVSFLNSMLRRAVGNLEALR